MLEVDVFSDIVCPWCFIGFRRLQQVLKETKTEATVTHRPFRLRRGPADEVIDLHAELRQKYGVDPRQMFARVQEAGRDVGIAFDFDKQPKSYSTVRAHTLLRRAGDEQAALLDALFTAYFIDGKNIADPEVLAAIAGQHGLDPDDTRALVTDETELIATAGAADEASRMGIDGVPFFIFNRQLAFSGAQPAEVFRQAIAEAALDVEHER